MAYINITDSGKVTVVCDDATVSLEAVQEQAAGRLHPHLRGTMSQVSIAKNGNARLGFDRSYFPKKDSRASDRENATNRSMAR